MTNTLLTMGFPIDAVITWVDGDDPAHRSKLRRYAGPSAVSEDDVAGPTRFSSLGEIQWCVRSLRKFAPFLNRIYIVTDGQDPHIPEGSIPVEIVDHKVLFRGYEQYLPVFNSIAIETMTWRIPGLSEHYIELNDDFLLCAPITAGDLYESEDVPVCYARKRLLPFDRFTRAVKPKVHGRQKVTFKGVMCNAAVLSGARLTYLRLNHTPRALSRSFFEDFYGRRPDLMEFNISFRFRNAGQFLSEEIYFLTRAREHRLSLKDDSRYLFYLEPKRKRDYVPRKLRLFASFPFVFLCVNSLDKADEEDRRLICDTVEGILARDL